MQSSFNSISLRIQTLAKNPHFLIVVYSIGGIVGLFNATISQLQQVLCSRGYPDWFSGVEGLTLLSCGIIGGIVASIIVQKTGRLVMVAKLAIGMAAILGCVIYQLFLIPDIQVIIAILTVIVGVFAFGILPLGFELCREVTHPLEPSTGISILFFVSQALSALLILISGVMEQELSDKYQSIETCSATGGGEESNIEAKNHMPYLLLLSCLIVSQALLLIIGYPNKTTTNK